MVADRWIDSRSHSSAQYRPCEDSVSPAERRPNGRPPPAAPVLEKCIKPLLSPSLPSVKEVDDGDPAHSTALSSAAKSEMSSRPMSIASDWAGHCRYLVAWTHHASPAIANRGLRITDVK